MDDCCWVRGTDWVGRTASHLEELRIPYGLLATELVSANRMHWSYDPMMLVEEVIVVADIRGSMVAWAEVRATPSFDPPTTSLNFIATF